MEITLKDILEAQKRISNYINITPLERTEKLKDKLDANLFLKLENLQVSGSFKTRGGFNKILKTLEIKDKAEFVAPTAGGHGVGFSYAAKITNTKTHILMPESTDSSRIEDIENNGANIQFFKSVDDAREEAIKLQNEEGYIYVSAYDDREMIEGGGTIALEILQQQPDIDCVVCGVGGGGYLAGMSVVLKAANPDIQILGVQQSHGGFLAEWFKTGNYPVDFILKPSFAEGIGGIVSKDVLTWKYLKENVSDFFTVTEEDIKDALIWMMDKQKHYVEPSAVVGLAGIRKYAERFSTYKNICTVITGRNMSFSKFRTIIES